MTFIKNVWQYGMENNLTPTSGSQSLVQKKFTSPFPQLFQPLVLNDCSLT